MLPTANSAHMLPPRLVKRILDLEYIDMAELVREAWRFQEEEQSGCCHHAKRRRRGRDRYTAVGRLLRLLNSTP